MLVSVVDDPRASSTDPLTFDKATLNELSTTTRTLEIKNDGASVIQAHIDLRGGDELD
jgi:hypothetical protein